MKKKELLDVGFRIYGIEENDIFYKITFKPPFKFNISSLSGNFNNDEFYLYENNTRYNNINDLIKVIDIVGTELYNFRK